MDLDLMSLDYLTVASGAADEADPDTRFPEEERDKHRTMEPDLYEGPEGF